MQLGVLTTSYKIAAVEIREKLAITEADIPKLINHIKATTGAGEVMVLSTCNRVEIYFQAGNPLSELDKVEEAIFNFFAFDKKTGFHFIKLTGREGIQHIFRVTSSLEAMVIGEPQVTGQVKNFFHLSVQAGGCGFFLNQILNKSFATAKRVRTETAIAKFAVSISFAAVELAKKIFNNLNNKVVLIIGAGEMAELAVNHLMKAGCSHLLVTNRTFSRAVSLAERFSGSAVQFDQLGQHLRTADIIISSTGAKGYIVTPELVQKSMRKRKHKPVFLIDIAVPRDIDPAINDIGNAYVYDIDDLRTVVDDNLKERQKEAETAQHIIEEELDKVDDWLATLEVVPTIKIFREQVINLANSELQKALSQMGDLSAKQERIVRSLINGFAYKFLHSPTVIMKQKAREGTAIMEYLQVISELFDLKPPEKEPIKNNVIKIK